jgi:hypothetical protein
MTTTDEEDLVLAGCREARTSLLRHSIVWLGIPLTCTLALLDAQALQAVVGRSAGWLVYGVYALFVIQTGAVSMIVGRRIRHELSWWAILAWAVLLVDLQVFSLAGPTGDWDVVKKLGFAVASSQIGILTCFGVLGGTVWRIRLPIVSMGLALAVFFALSMDGDDAWYVLLFFQCLATLVTCAVLRRFGFRIERLDMLPDDVAANNRLQFSIRHLFYWTTGVACLVAVGRLIGWRAIAAAGLELGRVPELLLYVPLLTLVSMIGMWGALGRESWWLRFGLLFLLQPVVGFAFGFGAYLAAKSSQSPWRNLFYSWRGGDLAMIELGIVWTVLAGMLLAGLLLVFRFSGNRLQRRAAS